MDRRNAKKQCMRMTRRMDDGWFQCSVTESEIHVRVKVVYQVRALIRTDIGFRMCNVVWPFPICVIVFCSEISDSA